LGSRYKEATSRFEKLLLAHIKKSTIRPHNYVRAPVPTNPPGPYLGNLVLYVRDRPGRSMADIASRRPFTQGKRHAERSQPSDYMFMEPVVGSAPYQSSFMRSLSGFQDPVILLIDE
jgi:hypothetical protein